jgi:phosphocarrier protein
VKTSSRFTSDVKLSREGVEVNGKSIMGIMMLAAAKGSSVSLTVNGADETEAFQAIGELITNGFGEE